MAFMVFYTAAMGIGTFVVRFQAFRQKKVNPKYYKTYDPSVGLPPEFTIRMGRHYDNLLQVPLVFLITCIVCMMVGLNGRVPLILAWVFVGSRIVHSIIHLGRNHVLKRAGVFAFGWFVILALWGVIVMHLAQTTP